jgi:hypothetical protein
MTLGKMLRVSRPALRADFQHYYGLNLRKALTGDDWTLREVGDLAAQLPRGAQIWVHIGGPGAITEQTEMLYAIEAALNMHRYEQTGAKGEPPKPREYPESVEEIERKQKLVGSRAQRWREKYMPKQDNT